jgi:hypothetical protein
VKIFSKTYKKHQSHQVEIIPTPDLIHYAALRCQDCAGLHLKWLSQTECSRLGVHFVAPKKAIKKTTVKWSQASQKQRDFYKSYQPRTSGLPRTPSILMGDRLTITDPYTGNSIHSIPVQHLEQLLKSGKVTNTQDKATIQKSIASRSGTHPGPSRNNTPC